MMIALNPNNGRATAPAEPPLDPLKTGQPVWRLLRVQDLPETPSRPVFASRHLGGSLRPTLTGTKDSSHGIA
jgi:hypothetical protein